MSKKRKIAYDISINKKCPNCKLFCWFYYRCKEHQEHYREHWAKQRWEIN